MMHQEIIGACGPVGCAPPGLVSPFYNPYYGAGAGYGGYGSYGGYGGGENLEIVGQQSRMARFGQEVPPVTPVMPPPTGTGTGAPTTGEQAQDWLARESFVGVTNRNLLLIAAAAGLGWYAISEGWVGGGRRSSSSDRDRGQGRRRSSASSSMEESRDRGRRGGRGARSGGGGSRGGRSRDFVWF